MAEDYVALGTAFVEAVNSGDAERVLGFADPEIRFEPLRAGTEGAFIGHEGLRRFMEDTRESFELFEATILESIEIEDGVVGIGILRIRGRGSGIETEIPVAALLRYRNGLMVQYKDYGDRQRALEAAGLD
jgi:ketosteroid isomerase-like protein